MIESRFWRQALRTDLTWLRLKRRFKRWTEEQQVLYERRLMLVGFQVRSLLERPKVSWEYATQRLSVTRFEKLGTRPFTKLDLLDIERHFDLEHPTEELLTAPQVCNQLIHYYIMFAGGGPRGFRTLLVASAG